MTFEGHRFLSYFQEPCIFIEKGETYEPSQKVYRIPAPFERHLCDRLSVQAEGESFVSVGETVQERLPVPPL